MARILYGGGISDVRGSIGGTTFARNASGSYARRRVTPTNPNTSRQSAARALFSMISGLWRGLTPAQRQGWQELAIEVGGQGVGTNAVRYTGQQLFMARNQQLAIIEQRFAYGGQGYVLDAPLLESMPEIEPGGLTVEYSGGEVVTVLSSIENVVNPGGTTVGRFLVLLYTSPIVSGGRTRPASVGRDLRLTTFTPTTATTSDITNAYVATHGTQGVTGLAAGSYEGQFVNVWAAYRLVNDTTGQSSPLQFAPGLIEVSDT